MARKVFPKNVAISNLHVITIVQNSIVFVFKNVGMNNSQVTEVTMQPITTHVLVKTKWKEYKIKEKDKRVNKLVIKIDITVSYCC